MNARHQLPLESIVAATDFSAASARATLRAARIARECGAGLHLLHVINNSLLDGMRAWLDNSGQWQERMTEQTRQSLLDEVQRLEALGHAPAQPHLATGQPVRTICAQARTLGAGLVVVGARGANPLHHLLIGSTAERLLHQTERPLLVVRTEADAPYQRVLVALDFSPWSEQAIVVAGAVAPGAHLILMHSFSIPFEEKLRFAGVDEATLEHYRERARTDASDHLQALVDRSGLLPHQFTLSLTEGDAPMHVLQQAEERGCDLIVIGKHGRQAAEELLLGSVTQHVLTEATCDVLASTAHDHNAIPMPSA